MVPDKHRHLHQNNRFVLSTEINYTYMALYAWPWRKLNCNIINLGTTVKLG